MGGRKLLIVGINYFTKWIEAEPVAKITTSEVKKFICRSIFARFGLPMAMVYDHGSQFDCKPVKDLLAMYKVKFAYAAVCHPQSNGQAEAANKQIIAAIKKKIEDAKSLWDDLIPKILWANRITVRGATGESPFTLVFGTKAIVLAEVGLPTFRIQHYCKEQNDLLLRQQLDFLLEVREKAAIKSTAYKDRMSWAYNRQVAYRPLNKGDLVLQRTAATGKGNEDGNLTANWEGLYRIRDMVMQWSFYLETMDEKPLKNLWNTAVLKKYYVQVK